MGYSGLCYKDMSEIMPAAELSSGLVFLKLPHLLGKLCIHTIYILKQNKNSRKKRLLFVFKHPMGR